MALHLREVAKTYGKGENAFQALKPVNIGINPGSTVAIVGKSGSGKSTLLHLMVGLDHPTSGEILFNGKNILKDYKTDAWRGENVGIIFQQFFLQPKDSVLDNVSLPLKLRGMSKRKRAVEAKDALRLVGLLDKAKSKANDLSGGQKQRVAIARAIVTKPAVLVADEPTGNLDSENGEAVERLLFQLNQQLNTTLIIVTHDEELASRCQRIIRLRDGMVVEDTGAHHKKAAPATTPQPAAHAPAVQRPTTPVPPAHPVSVKPVVRPNTVPVKTMPKVAGFQPKNLSVPKQLPSIPGFKRVGGLPPVVNNKGKNTIPGKPSVRPATLGDITPNSISPGSQKPVNRTPRRVI
jgi:putative ABC transport system ATP-binding protein